MMEDILGITEKDIGNTIIALAKSFNDELMEKSESELEKYWHFKWNNSASLELNVYHFHDMLKLYGSFCRRWEEAKHGSCCVVERVRDKYLMPKIRLVTNQITQHWSPTHKKTQCHVCKVAVGEKHLPVCSVSNDVFHP